MKLLTHILGQLLDEAPNQYTGLPHIISQECINKKQFLIFSYSKISYFCKTSYI